MAPGIRIQVYGKTYQVKGVSSVVEPEDLAAFVDDKMRELAGIGAGKTTSDLAVLAALNIAQELFEIRAGGNPGPSAEDRRADQLIARVRKELEQAGVDVSGIE